MLEEVANLMGIESADTNTEGWFNYRTAAAANILKNMTVAEKEDVKQFRKKLEEEGLPEELQRR